MSTGRIAGLVAGLLLLGALVGWAAQETGDDYINWEVAALAFTGFATLALAIATYGLAQQTRRDVDASTASAEAARRTAEVGAESLAASIRPVLGAAITDHPNLIADGESGRIVVSLVATFRNVGSGLAIVETSRLLTPLPHGATVEMTTAGFAVPVDAVVWVEAKVRFSDNSIAKEFREIRRAEGFAIEVRYSDMNGGQTHRTTLTAAHLPGVAWRVAELAIYSGDATEPFARMPRSVTVAPESLIHERSI